MISTTLRNTSEIASEPSRPHTKPVELFISPRKTSQNITPSGDTLSMNHTPPPLVNAPKKGSIVCTVGFSDLPNQMHKKAVSRGFTFNLMITGSPGLGKSTFVNALFSADVYNSDNLGPSKRPVSGTPRVDCHRFVISESNVKLQLSILDTPGFGQHVDNSRSWEPIAACIESKFDEYLKAEMKVSRTTYGSGCSYIPSLPDDPRVHACLYFVNPNGHGLHQLDINTMKQLHDKVNLIVVIGKADTMTAEECVEFKKVIQSQLEENKIQLYTFPAEVASLGGGATDKVMREITEWRQRQPFAVACSDRAIKDVEGRRVRGRVYPWGVMETDNLTHNDFVALQNLLLNVHLQDLIGVTNTRHYANFFATKMQSIAESVQFNTEPDGREPLSQLEAERIEQQKRLARMEADMESVFEQKVTERTAKLDETKRDMEQRIKQLNQKLVAEMADFEEQKRRFEEERAIWESDNQELLASSRPSIDAKEKTRTKRKNFF